MIPYIFRPIRMTDLEDLKSLREGMLDPIASLPNDGEVLAERIKLSQKSFAKKVNKPGKEFYFFVLEDVGSKKVIGVSGIEARVGGGGNFMVYEIGQESFVHAPLKISKTVNVLGSKTIKNGPSELCSLYLNPKYRVHGLGSLLSLARFLFISSFSQRFSDELIANLRGYRDKHGHSPFWETIGDVFFGDSLSTVDTMKSLGHGSFIKDLMPRHPIYIDLLPKKAQAVIGEVHPKTRPALHLLKKQGFKTDKWFDLFDAGPYALAKCKDIKTVRKIKQGIVSKIIESEIDKPVSLDLFLISNNALDFRACLGNIVKKSGGKKITLEANVAEALNLKVGSSISYLKC